MTVVRHGMATVATNTTGSLIDVSDPDAWTAFGGEPLFSRCCPCSDSTDAQCLSTKEKAPAPCDPLRYRAHRVRSPWRKVYHAPMLVRGSTPLGRQDD